MTFIKLKCNQLVFWSTLATFTLLLSGCFTSNNPSEAAFDNGMKIVRGVNTCPLDWEKIAAGNNPRVGRDEPLTNLSVNASDDRNVSYNDLARNLPNDHYSWATLGDLRRANEFVQIVADPLPGNPHHHLLSVITPREVASKMSGHCRETPD